MEQTKGLPQYHVMTLSVEKQATLRYLLWNYLNLKIMTLFNNLSIKNDADAVLKNADLSVKYTRQFDTLVADLCHFNSMKKKKPTSVYMFTEVNMHYIKMASRRYDDFLARKALGETEFSVVSRNITQLLDLVDKSSIFKYSYNEIRDERVRK